MCYAVQGMKAEHVVEKWKEMFPKLQLSVDEYVKQIQAGVKQRILEFGRPMEGVVETLEFFKSLGMKILVASASSYSLINTVLDKLEIKNYFDIIHSSQDEKLGKPHPDVFLHAAERIKSNYSDCLVIEDSVNGVRAGKAAGMTVIAIPAPENFKNPAFDIADYKLKSMADVKRIDLFMR